MSEPNLRPSTENVQNISIAGSQGGLLLGVGTPLDAHGNPLAVGSEMQFRTGPDTTWSRPLYACMSSVKASIREVEFELKGATSLNNLVVKSSSRINYTSAELPVWAMEDTGFEISDAVSPFWGLVSPDRSNSSGIQTMRSTHMYLPAGPSMESISLTGYTGDGAAGAYAPFAALGAIYYGSGTYGDMPDFLSGKDNWLLARRWSQLGARADTAGSI